MSVAVSLATAAGEASRTADSSKIPSAILVVEDEPEILAPLCHTLRRAGYIVFEAEDGLSACRIIGSQHPDLILLDIMLPDLDGWEVCRMLRQHPERRISTTPVIMLTALNSPEDKLHGLELGADAYLPKPYSQQEVLLISGKLIERHRREVALELEFAQLRQGVEQQRDLHALLFHELRNQLAILQVNADLLQHAGATAGPSQLAAIHRSSNYLQCLAEDFLLIRQVQGSGVQLPGEPLLIGELAAEMIALYAPAAQIRGIPLQLRIDGTLRPVTSNRPALKVILSALLDNAIKYGPPGRPVEVLCRINDWRLELEVHDSGDSLSTEEQARLFDRFYRGSVSGAVGGSGLGLFGARILAKALGGNAEVDDQHRQGNCFRVWLPLT
jgi:signal transduction histidine kinase